LLYAYSGAGSIFVMGVQAWTVLMVLPEVLYFLPEDTRFHRASSLILEI
jgi:hypothetical protein